MSHAHVPQHATDMSHAHVATARHGHARGVVTARGGHVRDWSGTSRPRTAPSRSRAVLWRDVPNGGLAGPQEVLAKNAFKHLRTALCLGFVVYSAVI